MVSPSRPNAKGLDILLYLLDGSYGLGDTRAANVSLEFF